MVDKDMTLEALQEMRRAYWMELEYSEIVDGWPLSHSMKFNMEDDCDKIIEFLEMHPDASAVLWHEDHVATDEENATWRELEGRIAIMQIKAIRAKKEIEACKQDDSVVADSENDSN